MSTVKTNARPKKLLNQETANIAAVEKSTETGNSLKNQTKRNAPTPLEIRFIENQTNLSSSRKRLLNQILNEPHETFFLSTRELGKRYGVDSATIVRTIQAMGYEKFADFAHDLRNHFVNQITPYTAMKAATQKHQSIADYVQRSLETDNENLAALKVSLDTEMVIELAKQIHQTRRIIIVGIDFAASLAMAMAYPAL